MVEASQEEHGQGDPGESQRIRKAAPRREVVPAAHGPRPQVIIQQPDESQADEIRVDAVLVVFLTIVLPQERRKLGLKRRGLRPVAESEKRRMEKRSGDDTVRELRTEEKRIVGKGDQHVETEARGAREFIEDPADDEILVDGAQAEGQGLSERVRGAEESRGRRRAEDEAVGPVQGPGRKPFFEMYARPAMSSACKAKPHQEKRPDSRRRPSGIGRFSLVSKRKDRSGNLREPG